MGTAGTEPRPSVSDRVRAIEAGGDSEPSDKRARNIPPQGARGAEAPTLAEANAESPERARL
eukprot:3926255-Alexandrium_andersonii.AAC.1